MGGRKHITFIKVCTMYNPHDEVKLLRPFIEQTSPAFSMLSQWIPHHKNTCYKTHMIRCLQTGEPPSLVMTKLGTFRSPYWIAYLFM